MDPAPTGTGYVHEIGFYSSDQEFHDLIVPFALGGLEAGDALVFAYDEYKMRLLRDWLPADLAITYVTDAGAYATPAKALGSWRELIEQQVAAGAPRVRIAGNVPHPGYGQPYSGWDRYEAAIDRALGDLPVWAPCLYDTRIAPPEVLETALRLHHHVLDRDGTCRPVDGYDAVTGFTDFLPVPADALEQTTPTLELVDPLLADVRAALRRVLAGRQQADRVDELILAVSEAAANGFLHGRPPVTIRAWVTSERVVVHVRDEGNGPTDPLVGLLHDAERPEGGRGLWLAHLLDLDVALITDGDGFTVRFRTELTG
jgi:anti-sigma regulatory factor (Ser/Thr protein kinase)